MEVLWIWMRSCGQNTQQNNVRFLPGTVTYGYKIGTYRSVYYKTVKGYHLRCQMSIVNWLVYKTAGKVDVYSISLVDGDRSPWKIKTRFYYVNTETFHTCIFLCCNKWTNWTVSLLPFKEAVKSTNRSVCNIGQLISPIHHSNPPQTLASLLTKKRVLLLQQKTNL